MCTRPWRSTCCFAAKLSLPKKTDATITTTAKKEKGHITKHIMVVSRAVLELIAYGDVVETRRKFDNGDDDVMTHREELIFFAKDEAMVTFLHERGADVNVRDDNLQTPLLYLLKKDDGDMRPIDVSMVELYVNLGADLTVVDKSKKNALHYAAMWFNLDVSLFLVSQGLNPYHVDKNGNDALAMYGEIGILLHEEVWWDPETEEEEILRYEERYLKYLQKIQTDIALIVAAREAYVRNKRWEKNWPLMCALTGSGLLSMNAQMALLLAQQAASDKSVKIPGIPRGTKAQNLAYLNHAIFGRENEYAILRRIVEYIG
jgi:hypothetical protein